MAGAPIVVPFDFEPDLVSVHTGSKTVPAGKYAYVVTEVKDGGTFTIDGSTALEAGKRQLVNLTGASASYTVNPGFNFEGYLSLTNGATSIEINGIQVTTGILFKLYDGHVVTAIGGGTPRVVAFGYETENKDFTVTESFWVPTGTVLNGTGDFTFTYSEYSQKT